ERRREQTQSEGHDEHDGTVPHGPLLKLALCLPFSFEAERCASAAPGSRSAAEAGGRRLQAQRSAETWGSLPLGLPMSPLSLGRGPAYSTPPPTSPAW